MAHKAKSNLFIRSAIEYMCATGGAQTEERLAELVRRYCYLYMVDPDPHVRDAIDYFRTDEFKFIHGND